MKLFSFIMISMFSFNVFSGEVLVKNSRITEIGNSPDGSNSFFVRTAGGEGPCTNGVVIVFPDDITSKEKQSRAYSLALTAYTTGNADVNISTFENEVNCRRAQYILLH